jgi:hypothetical protein
MSDYPFTNWNDFYLALNNNLMDYYYYLNKINNVNKINTPIFDEKWENTSYKGNLVIECINNLLNKKLSSNDGLYLMIKLLLNHNSNNYKEYNYLLGSLERNLEMGVRKDYKITIQTILELFFENNATIDLLPIMSEVFHSKDIYFKDNKNAKHNIEDEFLSYELRGLILDILISYTNTKGNITELKNLLNTFVDWKNVETFEIDDLLGEVNDMSELNNKDQFENIRYMVLKSYSINLQEIYQN